MEQNIVNKDTPLVMVTVGQFADYLVTSGLIGDKPPGDGEPTGLVAESEECFGWGLGSIMERYHCSRTTAMRYKDTFLAPAITQVGRLIKVNLLEADRLFEKNSRK